MGKRRQKATREKRASSTDIRFTLLVMVVGVLILVLGGAVLSEARAGDWTGAAIPGGVVAVLLAVTVYSARQRRS
jgi:hypothetical protein